ncbi:MAG: hypothetical protein KBE04_02995 [Phycisphaerae bacterium]|nr:hypothetical protein [Phycisphaerae bacterium]
MDCIEYLGHKGVTTFGVTLTAGRDPGPARPSKVARGRRSAWACSLILILVAGNRMALGQFVVQPMRHDLAVRPRTRVETQVLLQNQERAETQYVEMRTLELAQNEDASWLPIDPDEIDPNSPVDMALIAKSSCRSWITLGRGTDTPVQVRPMRMEPVNVVIDVPNGVKGFYCAAIAATLRPRPDVGGVPLTFRFVVPVLIRIEGPVASPKVELVDSGIEVVPELEDSPASTDILLCVENNGATHSRLRPRAQLCYEAGGVWKVVVAQVPFPEVDIIPGSRLKLRSNIGRTLPAGNYLVRGDLLVDARRVKGVDKEISFAGSASGSHLAADAAIRLGSPAVIIQSAPGAMRSSIVEVASDCPDPVTIRVHVQEPRATGGRANVATGIKSTDLSCADWVEVTPSEFTLRPYGRQNVRVVARMPGSNTEHRGYYADLNLFASYADGTNAGTTDAQICVLNQKAENKSLIQPDVMKIDKTEASVHTVVARFFNMGDVHITPKCEAVLLQPDGQPIKTGRMRSEGAPSLMLPLEKRDFSGELDLTYIKAGTYLLRAVLEDSSSEPNAVAPGRLEKPLRISIDEKGQRFVEVISESAFKDEAGKARGAVRW